MRRRIPELTDDDLARLARLGGAVDQIAEAAGIDAAQVRRRLDGAAHLATSGDRQTASPVDALCA